MAIINIGFKLEKKDEFYQENLVKNNDTMYAPPGAAQEDGSVFYDKSFNITREGKLFAMSDYVCRLAQSDKIHTIQLDDYDESQQLRIPELPIEVPAETFPEMTLVQRPGRQRLTYVPKCNID